MYNFYNFTPRIYKKPDSVCNIKHMILKTINDRCNMTYKYYKNTAMSMIERRINIIIAKNPELINSLDRNKNHPLIRKYSHIPLL